MSAKTHLIRKGLDLPISGKPSTTIDDSRQVKHLACVALDYVGMKPRMEVREGDTVQRGQLLFSDRKAPGVIHTAPGAGRIVGVHRGDKRRLLTVVIELNEREQSGATTDEDYAVFGSYEAVRGQDVSGLKSEDVRALLVESGLWTALRARPYSVVPAPDTQPRAIFVTALDTRPLCASAEDALQGYEDDFVQGLKVLTRIADVPVYLCRARGSKLGDGVSGVETHEFSGPHPAGLVGTHIHTIDPVCREKVAWHINYADVHAVGRLFQTGRLDLQRIISLAGPIVKEPRLLRTRAGASIDELLGKDSLQDGENRIISGCVLAGRGIFTPQTSFLSRYDLQITALAEGREREFLGWLSPGMGKFSTLPTYLSALFGWKGKSFDMTTSTHGSHRAMVPIGMYERVFPLDILPTFLLRSLCVDDLEKAELLGALELDEEDLALCTLVCPGKVDYGPILRRNLDTIHQEG